MVEVLVAILLLGLIVVLTAQPLINSLNISGTSSTTLAGTRKAQDVMERARSVVMANYNAPMGPLSLMPKDTSTVICQDISLANVVTGSCNDMAAGSNSLFAPFKRRLIVTTPIDKQTPVVLTLDVR